MFHLRNISKNFTNAAACFRHKYSVQVKSLVDVSVDGEGIATVQMQRAPVNSFNLELMQELHDALIEVKENNCKGMVLTSAYPTIFSAGADLMELHKPDVERLTKLKETIFDVVVKLFGTDIITTAAINGYTGAGACILALTCEYRTMTTGSATIGLNDSAVGIRPAKWIAELMTRAMVPRHAEYALTTSFMFPAERAFQVGLIDEVATNKADAIQKCKDFIKIYDNISPAIRAATKQSLREEYLTNFKNNRKQIVTDFLDTITSPVVQDKIDKYVQSLKQKKAVKV